MPMRSRNFVIVWLASFIGGCILFVGINFYVDPLWLFEHENHYNKSQWGFDERQQKTNLVRFSEFNYDGLLLGSSRTTHINQWAFADTRVFNYAAVGMRPVEFSGYVAFAQSVRRRPFKVIYLGMDFVATNRLNPGSPLRAGHYVQSSEALLYRLESLLNYDTFGKSFRNIRQAASTTACDCYNRQNVKRLPAAPLDIRTAAVSSDIAAYSTKVYGPDYVYEDRLKLILASLKNDHLGTRFVPFITPPSYKLFQVLVRMGRLPDYERWLTEMIDVFGGVYDFSGRNSITTNMDNYVDGHHFRDNVGDLIVARLENRIIGGDFGVYITRQNLASHIAAIREQARLVMTMP